LTEIITVGLLLEATEKTAVSWPQFVTGLKTLTTTFGPHQFFIVGAFLFCAGFYGVIARRNMIAVLLATELMLNGVNVLFVAFNRWWGVKLTRAAFTSAENVYSPVGQIFAIFVIIVAAAEAAVGLAIIIAFYRQRKSAYFEDATLMKW